MELPIDKAFLIALYPFFVFVLIIGFLVYNGRGGRPVRLKLRGLGISFELDNSACADSRHFAEEILKPEQTKV